MANSQNNLEAAAREQLLTRFGNLALDYSTAFKKKVETQHKQGLERIRLVATPKEYTDLFLLTQVQHDPTQKIILVFVSLCEELRRLVDQAKEEFLFPLLLFGEAAPSDDESAETLKAPVSAFLPVLLKLQVYVRRCRTVIEHVLKQIDAFYTCLNHGIETKGVHIKPVYEKLSELLSTLATLDAVIEDNETLRDEFKNFDNSIQTANHDPVRFNVTRDDLGKLSEVVRAVRRELLSGNIFQNATDLDTPCSNVVVSEITTNVRGRLSDLFKEDVLFLSTETMRITCLFTLGMKLADTVDKKLANQIWDLRKKIPAVPVACHNLWLISNHLLKHLPGSDKLFDSKQLKSAENDKLSFVRLRDAEIFKDLPQWEAKVSAWEAKFQESFEVVNPTIEQIEKMSELMQTGYKYAYTLKHTAELQLNLHAHFCPAMSKALLLAVWRHVELADWLIACLKKKGLSIVKTIVTSQEHVAYSAISSLLSVQKRIADDKKNKDRQTLLSALLALTCRSLSGPITEQRKMIARLALACACGSSPALTSEERSVVGEMLRKLELYSTFERKLDLLDDFSFLYWNRTLLPVCIADVYKQKKGVTSVTVLTERFCDILNQSRRFNENEVDPAIEKRLTEEITEYVKSMVLDPLCRDIELDLRLSTHTHLGGTEKPFFKEGIPDFNALLNGEPIVIAEKRVSAAEYVTNYLDRTFYNLTSVASHDWKTYMEMRTVAKQRFNLYTSDDRLPIQRLEQGLDVLEIIRNINVFASHYGYDLYSQSFIERQSDGKFLTTIGIRHIANSIRTHGSGIVSSAVNYSYQFLRQKFHIFSQFLYDEQIKSRLIKDLKMTRELRNTVAGDEASQKFVVVYPYDKAEKFVRGIKNLGITNEGRSYLDEFRLLITEVGNVMGYVRMLRSGNLHCCASTSDALPSEIPALGRLNAVAESFSQVTRDAIVELERVLENVAKNFEGGSDFLKLLVQAFAPAFRDTKHSHLKLFYLIIPPLTISYVEHMRTGKEKLQRKDKQTAFFTDDGLVIGLAYILALLDQNAEFDSLHWFETVSQRYTDALVDVRHQQAISASGGGRKNEDSEKLKQTLSLTIRRLETHRQEFQLLEYSLVSARALFRSSLSRIPKPEQEDSQSFGAVPSLSGESEHSSV